MLAEEKTKELLLDEIRNLRKQIHDLKNSAPQSFRQAPSSPVSEDKYRLLVENFPQGVIIVQDGVFKFINAKALQYVGAPEEELLGRSFIEFVHPDYRRTVIERHFQRLRGENPPDRYPVRFTDPKGKSGWAELQVISVRWNGRPATLSFLTDITSRKQTEKELLENQQRLHSLSAKLLDGQEAERRRIARELHDELGQSLAFLKLRIASHMKMLGAETGLLKEDFEETLEYINQIIENVRRLSKDLSPTILADLGLVSSLRWLVEQFMEQYAVEMTHDLADIDHLFSEEDQVNIYRLFQEALNNVAKHSEARQAHVELRLDNGRVLALIEDKGNGFDVNQTLDSTSTRRGIGLATMKERARMLNGQLEIKSELGKGTVIDLRIPIK